VRLKWLMVMYIRERYTVMITTICTSSCRCRTGTPIPIVFFQALEVASEVLEDMVLVFHSLYVHFFLDSDSSDFRSSTLDDSDVFGNSLFEKPSCKSNWAFLLQLCLGFLQLRTGCRFSSKCN
jgi:hypothetical protein